MVQSGKAVLQLDDLAKAMEEFGVALRRPPFLEDRQKETPSIMNVNQQFYNQMISNAAVLQQQQ